MKNKYKSAVAIIGWFGLVLQLYLMLATVNEKSAVQKIINYFSYFTILTNIIVAFSLTVSLLSPSSKMGNFFSSPYTESAITVYIIIVGIIHFFLLRNLADLKSWNMVADTILHKIIPMLYAFYWVKFVTKDKLHWKDSMQWLLYPVIYLFYVLVRGFIDCFYPYPFADVGKLGYSKALMNGILIIASFWILGLVLIFINNLMIKKSSQKL
jgi:hypothetical protein